MNKKIFTVRIEQPITEMPVLAYDESDAKRIANEIMRSKIFNFVVEPPKEDIKEYRFYIDTKITTWEREYFTIESSSFEEAKEIAVQQYDGDICIDADSYESLSDTDEEMSLTENGGNPTRELYSEDNTFIKSNGSEKIENYLKH